MNRKILPDEQEKESHSQQRGEQVVAVARKWDIFRKL